MGSIFLEIDEDGNVEMAIRRLSPDLTVQLLIEAALRMTVQFGLADEGPDDDGERLFQQLAEALLADDGEEAKP